MYIYKSEGCGFYISISYIYIYIYIHIHLFTKGCLKTDVKCGSFVLQCQMWGKADVKYPILLYKLLWWRGSFDFLLISQLYNIFFNIFLGDLFVKEKWYILVVYNTSEIMHQIINTAKFILDKTFAAYIKHAGECLWMITYIWKLSFDLPYYEFADWKDGTSAFSKRLTILNWPPRLYRIYKATSLSNKQLGFFTTYSRITST